MTVIKCPVCDYDNYVFEDDLDPACQICDALLKPVEDDGEEEIDNYDEIPF